jgi:hypothetical protein
MIDRQELVRRAQQYCQRNGLQLGLQLGHGVHGNVFAAKSEANVDHSAIKIHDRERFYHREREVYRRLSEESITSVSGCAVPEVLRHDDELLAIEMSIVTPPFLLDFAGAYLDQQPDYSEEVIAEWLSEKAEQFGERWPKVQSILRQLERIGIYLADVNPGNIRFE